MWTGLWLGMFSFATSLPVAMLCFFLGSSTVPVVITTANGLLQVLAPADMRARVISTWLMVSFGIQPFAQLVIGFNADHLGPAGAIRLNAALLILGALLVLVARLDLRRWEIAIDSRASARAPVRAVQPE